MKNTTFLWIAAATFALLAGSPAAKAVTPQLGLVIPLDTFSFDVVAYNNAAGVAAYAVSPIDTTFGLTTTYAGAGLGGSNVTITSGETLDPVAQTTTDTFTVSTPSNFAPTGYKIGSTAIRGLQFDIDQDTTYADPVNLVTAISADTSTGTIIYGTSSTLTGAPLVTLLNGGSAYQALEAISVNSGSINGSTVHSFTLSVTYATVPEPSTWAMCGVGLVGCAGVVFRRRRFSA